MTSKEISIEFFTGLARNKGERKYSRNAFDAALDGLGTSSSDGFTEEEIEILIEVLVTYNIPAKPFRRLICLVIVPKTTVSETAVTEMILWLCSCYDTAVNSSVVLALQWLAGILDFGLAKEEYLDGFYEFFFTFLQRPKLEVYASKLIYMLTKPDDISRWRVKSVLKVHEKNKQQKHTLALLCQFKSFRPECVPENIPTLNVLSAFRNIPELMKSQFYRAHMRKQEEGEGADAGRVATIDWRNKISGIQMPSAAKRSKKDDFIPAIDYIQFGSSLYKEKSVCSILQFKTIESLGCYQLSLDMPSQVMSLLTNKAGYQVLAFVDIRQQERLSFVLYKHLYSAFIKRSIRASVESKERVLDQLIEFEKYIQQGIPVVSRILAEIMHCGNGYNFRKQIFPLIEWITFSSFQELDRVILEHMHIFFLQSDVMGKCLIIGTLKRLLSNLYLDVYRRQNGFPLLFMRDLPMWDSEDVLHKLTQFIQDLCTLGLASDPHSTFLLNESLSFYEMVSQLENQTDQGLPLWTIMSPGIFYRGIFTSDAVAMSRVCALMNRYREVDVRRLRNLGVLKDFQDQLDKVNMYAADLFNCLLNGKAKTLREKGFIFKNMRKSYMNRLSQFVDIDRALMIRHHIALAPYFLCKGSRKERAQELQKLVPELGKILLTNSDGDFLRKH